MHSLSLSFLPPLSYHFHMSQTERINYIGKALVERGGVTLKEVAEEFGVNTRTACRDIEYMRDRLDAPIEFSRRNHCYELVKPWGDYTNLEERMIILAAYMNSLLDTIPLGSTISDGVKDTISQGLGMKGRRVLEKVDYRAQSIDLPDYSVFKGICDAIAANCAIRIDYFNLKGERSEGRIVEPERLINYNSSWYMVAFDHRRNALRQFHLSRIQNIELVRDIEIRSIPANEMESFLSGSFGIFFGRRIEHCTIHFSGLAARIVSTQLWHKSQRMKHNEDGSIDMTIPVSSYKELLNRVISFAGEAVPVSPESFVDEYRRTIIRMYESL